MKKYPNYYEGVKEARDRLRGTIILYGGLPYYVLGIFDTEEIYDIWLEPIGRDPKDPEATKFRKIVISYGPDYLPLGTMLADALKGSPNSGVLRVKMDDPKFNGFKPFPLGMCNVGTQVYYVERQPTRPLMHQGLVKSALFETLITAGSRQDNPRHILENVDIFTPAFKDTILGDYYSAQEVLRALSNPNIANDAHAFHREFALVRGPIDMIFLAYRSDVIGVLPKGTFDFVRLGKEFDYCAEVVEELGIFHRVIV